MPRKKLPDPRRNWTLRLSDAELDQLDRDAARAGLTPSEHARDRLFGKQAPSFRVPSVATERHRLATAVLADQLKRVGVNLNQLVRHVHQHPDERVPSDTALIVGQIRTMVRLARDL